MDVKYFVDPELIAFSKGIGERLVAKKMQIGTAESCTGGRIASIITSVPKSSEYFVGGVVSYSNEVKQNILGVNPQDITEQGAVSCPVVEQMAKGASRVLGCECAVATSGIAGPDGGSPEKPVGTVWIAAVVNRKVTSACYHFHGDRQEIIQQSAYRALEMLLEMLKELD